jgi:hypothetical protein
MHENENKIMTKNYGQVQQNLIAKVVELTKMSTPT